MSDKKKKKLQNTDDIEVLESEDPTEISNEQLQDLAKEAVKKFKSLS